jgi:hypothetical protein
MPDRTLLIDGVRVPRFLYGTAWKEDETRRLTELALRQGFRGIDTANQCRHYDEAAVGQAIAAAVAGGRVARDELFLQTKFTFRRGQDHRLPYDPDAPIRTQVEQSFASSLEHLGAGVIDSYLLHGPTQPVGLAEADWGGLAGDGGPPRQRPGPPAGRQQRHPRTAPAPLCAGAGPAPDRPEPVLRRPGLGPPRAGVLRRPRAGLPGLLPADRQPRGAGPDRVGPDRPAPRAGPSARPSTGSPWRAADAAARLEANEIFVYIIRM